MVALILMVACTDGGKDSGGETGATTVTLANDIQPIFNRNCAFSGCHDSDNPVVGDDFTVTLNLAEGQAHANLVNVPSEEVPTMMRVTPGDPDASYFWHKLNDTHLTVGGVGTRMPTELMLSGTDLATVEAWITGGALP